MLPFSADVYRVDNTQEHGPSFGGPLAAMGDWGLALQNLRVTLGK